MKCCLWHRAGVVVLCMLMLAGCGRSSKPKYRVGVSQCCEDIWRSKMNRELSDELVFHPDMTLIFRQAADDSHLQCMQIDSFIHERVDLLIVSPNEAEAVLPAIDRAYDAGIPIVIADRRVPGNKWTAYVGGDNRQVGVQMAQWLIQMQKRIGHPIEVLEITGNMATTPALMRHEGLLDGLHKSRSIRIVGEASGAWRQDEAERVCDSLLSAYPDVDAIVAQNDLMAYGAATAVKRHGWNIPVLGVDGLSGEGGGIEAVLKGRIAATATYPSRGDLILQRAAEILHGEPFARETNLFSLLVGPDEAKAMVMLYTEHETQMAALLKLRSNMNHLTEHYNLQIIVIWLLIAFILLLIVFGTSLWLIYHYHNRMLRESLERQQLQQHQQSMLHQLSSQIDNNTDVLIPQEEEKLFMDRLRAEIEAHISDPELSVESLAVSLCMSRTVLFRRTKAAVGISPVELIRHMRLQRANTLLQSGTMTVQQVAYEVGFSTPAYFARCYKECFGISPADVKNRS